MVGFTAEVTLEELVAIGKKHNLPVMEDLGSGAFIDLKPVRLVQGTDRRGKNSSRREHRDV